MTKKKDPSELKPRGGARPGSGRASYAPEVDKWPLILKDMLRVSGKGNGYVLPKSHMIPLKTIRARFGTKALLEFKEHFRSERLFDQTKADAIQAKLLQGRYDTAPASWPKKALEHYSPTKYAHWLINQKCFSPIWMLKSEMYNKQWLMFNGITLT